MTNEATVGMKFKPKDESGVYGVCMEILDDIAYMKWVYDDNSSIAFTINVDKVPKMFEYYGWIELSPLEEELL